AVRRNSLQRGVQLIATVAPVGSKHVAGETFTVHSHQRCIRTGRIPHGHRTMSDAVVRIGAERERTVVSGQCERRAKTKISMRFVSLLPVHGSSVGTLPDGWLCFECPRCLEERPTEYLSTRERF